MMLVEVRCCCDAHLVGWLPLPGVPEIGRVYVYEMVLGQIGRAEVEAMIAGRLDCRADLEFECAWVGEGGARFPALKSRDYPIERLRRIPGFFEASRRSET